MNQIKTFKAGSMQEALAIVRSELGSDAVILNTRQISHRRLIPFLKKRQEVEIVQAKKETELTVREGNLAAEKKRFEENLKFNTERFQSMENYMKEQMKSILERLPNVNLEIKRGK